MNAEQTKQAAEIMLAFAGGKTVEAKPKPGTLLHGYEWIKVVDPVWDFPCYEYRVKPEPMRVSAVVSACGIPQFVSLSRECCERWREMTPGSVVREFVEVLP